jgi:uncharacterized protein
MRWEFGRKSSNVEDRRDGQLSGPVVGGGIGAVVLSLIVAFLGGDPSVILNQFNNTGDRNAAQSPQTARSAEDQRMTEFVKVVLADTEDTWKSIFVESGKTYVEPKLVLFTAQVSSACGFATAAVGPFYCPADQKLYIDLSFYEDLKTKYAAPGDFAQAYVIAHEVGHHVQNLLGTSRQVQAKQRQVEPAQANQLSVRQELQADCYAGIWAYHAQRSRQILEEGDIEEALGAASSVGDDRLQKQAQGYVTPESFTHGSSAQRARWFKQGFKSGDLGKCNTFTARNL